MIELAKCGLGKSVLLVGFAMMKGEWVRDWKPIYQRGLGDAARGLEPFPCSLALAAWHVCRHC